MFFFKKFGLEDAGCAMKIGTDAVLLGSWTDASVCKNVLDIGTGCGILAIMTAQKSDAKITAIEIEPVAALQATQNAAQSPWSERINVVNTSLQAFASGKSLCYDMIICNPPFFQNSLPTNNLARNFARHNTALSYAELAQTASALLIEDGSLNVIIPFTEAENFEVLCNKYELMLLKKTAAISVEGKNPNRMLLCFRKTKNKELSPHSDAIAIRHSDNTYTEAYKELTRAFLLNS